MRRAALILVLALAGIAVFTGSLAWLLTDPAPPPGAPREERLYLGFCAGCHGAEGRGSWRAALFVIRPGDLTTPPGLPHRSDAYLFDVIKHGGSPIGRPGMPAFGAQLGDEDVRALVAYVRALGRERPAR